MEHKCICACHGTAFNSSKLHEPVNHDIKCCENMNGFVPHKDEVEEDYSKHDHSHCWTEKKPPCGQRIKHFECCLCKELDPEIKTLLAHREESLRGKIEEIINEISSDDKAYDACLKIQALLSDKS